MAHLVLALSALSGVNSIACSQAQFPKFIGGTGGKTTIHQLDSHAPTTQLAAVGSTKDGTMTSGFAGTSSEVGIIVNY